MASSSKRNVPSFLRNRPSKSNKSAPTAQDLQLACSSGAMRFNVKALMVGPVKEPKKQSKKPRKIITVMINTDPKTLNTGTGPFVVKSGNDILFYDPNAQNYNNNPPPNYEEAEDANMSEKEAQAQALVDGNTNKEVASIGSSSKPNPEKSTPALLTASSQPTGTTAAVDSKRQKLDENGKYVSVGGEDNASAPVVGFKKKSLKKTPNNASSAAAASSATTTSCLSFTSQMPDIVSPFHGKRKHLRFFRYQVIELTIFGNVSKPDGSAFKIYDSVLIKELRLSFKLCTKGSGKIYANWNCSGIEPWNEKACQSNAVCKSFNGHSLRFVPPKALDGDMLSVSDLSKEYEEDRELIEESIKDLTKEMKDAKMAEFDSKVKDHLLSLVEEDFAREEVLQNKMVPLKLSGRFETMHPRETRYTLIKEKVFLEGDRAFVLKKDDGKVVPHIRFYMTIDSRRWDETIQDEVNEKISLSFYVPHVPDIATKRTADYHSFCLNTSDECETFGPILIPHVEGAALVFNNYTATLSAPANISASRNRQLTQQPGPLLNRHHHHHDDDGDAKVHTEDSNPHGDGDTRMQDGNQQADSMQDQGEENGAAWQPQEEEGDGGNGQDTSAQADADTDTANAYGDVQETIDRETHDNDASAGYDNGMSASHPYEQNDRKEFGESEGEENSVKFDGGLCYIVKGILPYIPIAIVKTSYMISMERARQMFVQRWGKENSTTHPFTPNVDRALHSGVINLSSDFNGFATYKESPEDFCFFVMNNTPKSPAFAIKETSLVEDARKGRDPALPPGTTDDELRSAIKMQVQLTEELLKQRESGTVAPENVQYKVEITAKHLLFVVPMEEVLYCVKALSNRRQEELEDKRLDQILDLCDDSQDEEKMAALPVKPGWFDRYSQVDVDTEFDKVCVWTE